MMSRSVQENVNFAKVAECSERYEDMNHYAKEAVKLSIDGRNQRQPGDEEVRLLAQSFKCKVASRRTAWRALALQQAKDANPKNRGTAIVQFYKEAIEKEIADISQEAIAQANTLLPFEVHRGEAYKIKGDFHRYLCEIVKNPQEGKKLQKQCQNSYKKGIEEVGKDMKAYDPHRLALYLNLSVFYYEIQSQVQKAIDMCEEGFSAALEQISDLDEPKYTDSVTIMQLMHDNIITWKAQLQSKNK